MNDNGSIFNEKEHAAPPRTITTRRGGKTNSSSSFMSSSQYDESASSVSAQADEKDSNWDISSNKFVDNDRKFASTAVGDSHHAHDDKCQPMGPSSEIFEAKNLIDALPEVPSHAVRCNGGNGDQYQYDHSVSLSNEAKSGETKQSEDSTTTSVKTQLPAVEVQGLEVIDEDIMEMELSHEAEVVTAEPVHVKAEPLALIRFLRLVAYVSPSPSFTKVLQQAEPVIIRWASALHFFLLTLYIIFEILVELGFEAYSVLQPYSPELLAPCAFGLVMCFFGGSFVTTIAAFEAYRLVGYESTWRCIRDLSEDFLRILEAAERDAACGIDDVEPRLEDVRLDAAASTSSAHIADADTNASDDGGDSGTSTNRDGLGGDFSSLIPGVVAVASAEITNSATASTTVTSANGSSGGASSANRQLSEAADSKESNLRSSSSRTSGTSVTCAAIASEVPSVNTRAAAARRANVLLSTTSSISSTSGAGTGTGTGSSSSLLGTPRRRSMFSPRPGGLEAFRATVRKQQLLEHQQRLEEELEAEEEELLRQRQRYQSPEQRPSNRQSADHKDDKSPPRTPEAKSNQREQNASGSHSHSLRSSRNSSSSRSAEKPRWNSSTTSSSSPFSSSFSTATPKRRSLFRSPPPPPPPRQSPQNTGSAEAKGGSPRGRNDCFSPMHGAATQATATKPSSSSSSSSSLSSDSKKNDSDVLHIADTKPNSSTVVNSADNESKSSQFQWDEQQAKSQETSTFVPRSSMFSSSSSALLAAFDNNKTHATTYAANATNAAAVGGSDDSNSSIQSSTAAAAAAAAAGGGGGVVTLQQYQRLVELQGTDTLTSKVMFFLQNVDPARFSEALIGLNAGLVAVVATLKVQFARTITLGTAMSKTVEAPLKNVFLPVLQAGLPKPYAKWADLLLSYGIKSCAISIAWVLRRVISSYHSAFRGGLMCSQHLVEYLLHIGVVSAKDTTPEQRTFWAQCVGYALAATGIYFQLSRGFSLPFPLNVILLPFSILEYLLVWAVNNSHYILGAGS